MVNTIHVFDCFHFYILVKYIYSVDVLATDSFYIFWCQFDTLDWNRCERFDNSIISTGGDWILLRRKRVPQFKFPTCWQKKCFFLHFSSFPFFVEVTNFQSALLNLESLREKLWRPMFEEICFYCISVFISLFCWK